MTRVSARHPTKHARPMRLVLQDIRGWKGVNVICILFYAFSYEWPAYQVYGSRDISRQIFARAVNPIAVWPERVMRDEKR